MFEHLDRRMCAMVQVTNISRLRCGQDGQEWPPPPPGTLTLLGPTNISIVSGYSSDRFGSVWSTPPPAPPSQSSWIFTISKTSYLDNMCSDNRDPLMYLHNTPWTKCFIKQRLLIMGMCLSTDLDTVDCNNIMLDLIFDLYPTHHKSIKICIFLVNCHQV